MDGQGYANERQLFEMIALPFCMALLSLLVFYRWAFGSILCSWMLESTASCCIRYVYQSKTVTLGAYSLATGAQGEIVTDVSVWISVACGVFKMLTLV